MHGSAPTDVVVPAQISAEGHHAIQLNTAGEHARLYWPLSLRTHGDSGAIEKSWPLAQLAMLEYPISVNGKSRKICNNLASCDEHLAYLSK